MISGDEHGFCSTCFRWPGFYRWRLYFHTFYCQATVIVENAFKTLLLQPGEKEGMQSALFASISLFVIIVWLIA